jgi:hypothetical protein
MGVVRGLLKYRTNTSRSRSPLVGSAFAAIKDTVEKLATLTVHGDI